jgi:Protein of unknown function (DUF1579)
MQLRRVVYAWMTMALVTALVTGVAVAQEKGDQARKNGKAGKEPDPQAMMAAYEKAAAPGEQHKMLQKQVGKWNLSLKSWHAPGQPPEESTGTAETKSLLGDRYIQTTLNSTMTGRSFSGQGTTGYDNARKKFVGTWIDSMSTGIMRSEGTTDPSGKVMTTQASYTDPVTGKETRMKIVGKWESDDKLVEEFYEKRGGKEAKTMEITYTRAK